MKFLKAPWAGSQPLTGAASQLCDDRFVAARFRFDEHDPLTAAYNESQDARLGNEEVTDRLDKKHGRAD